MTASLPPSLQAAHRVVEALIGSGTRDFAYCPGSRNAPFAYVLARAEAAGRVRVHTFAEERGAAFWALGAAQALGGKTPVAVLTTSGTAVAELHPALEEAAHQGLPVVAVTADRPFEMSAVGASQSTRQQGLLASAVIAEVDIPADSSGSAIQNRVFRVLARTLGLGGRPGPAHLNVALRDPLVPEDMETYFAPESPEGDAASAKNPALFALTRECVPQSFPLWDEVVNPQLRTVVVAGAVEPRGQDIARSVVEQAALRGLPLLAEPSSGVTDSPNWIAHQPWLLERLADEVEQVIVVGKPTLSRPVARLLSREDMRIVVIADHEQWPGSGHGETTVVPGLRASKGEVDSTGGSWLARWQLVAREADDVLVRHDLDGELDYLTAARAIWSADPKVDLWLGASNTVRAFDLGVSAPGRTGVFTNRGLAGIDGSISSALGVQAMRGRPLRAVMGDLTFTYDLPSLAARPGTPPDLQLIVFDDGGGSIFASLEHGQAPEQIYERYFAVPQQLDIIQVAQACGWNARDITTLNQFEAALADPVQGRSLLHLKVPRPAGLFKRINSQICQ
ncbi:2-succinyl-5-enolpyruvyl-6-hydroxy-3-cyclohexene-1-carboxylic-acid synthase [Actinomyces minihominis]|uniref:2-succinyl-5-enolpyruvyl-6-hydroxy-3- cyclohexene-1-carboxylic-acid synthase n=1 Tax=Actinomyces minihominis TaxID=2002838 RepID=UPI000C08CDE0|nr:2-succinyl-5-enolpyruvyl-6-hydroxy-3-cyclohexene-1-carboxylic-acid synthase [Actinomyces minihominis]